VIGEENSKVQDLAEYFVLGWSDPPHISGRESRAGPTTNRNQHSAAKRRAAYPGQGTQDREYGARG